MRLGVDLSILNQKGTPAFYSDIFANRPAAGFAGRVFISTDTGEIYEDTGSAWTLIADAGAGTTGTLEQVTTNGNTTTKGLVVTAGNVAIGTATASAPLDIHATGTNAQFNGTGANNAYLQFQNAGVNKWRVGNTYAAGVNNYEIYNNPNTTTAISINGSTSVATINKGTRLGGTSGDDQLYVYGTSPSIRVMDAFPSPTKTAFFGLATATNNFIQGSASGDVAIGTAFGGKILIGTASGTVNPTMTFTNAGNVGIGTTSPSDRLNVVVSANGNNTRFDGPTSGLIIQTNASTTDIISYGGTTPAYRALNFSTSAGTNMTITTAGSVCIGTTSGIGVLNVQYDGNTINAITTRPINSYSAAAVNFLNISGTSVGYIIANASATAYVTTSDYRLKQDLKQYNGLDLVNSIKTYDYEWKIDNSRAFGVMAHELKEIIPYAVYGEKDGKEMQGVDYSKIVPILVKAIQELSAEIEELKNK